MASGRQFRALFGALGVVTASVAFGGVASATPTVTLTPSSNLYDQQTIEVSVGANTLFAPNSSIKILECQAGATSDAQCDGNTQNADSVIVGADGSFDYKSYTLYQLPSSLLGEPSTNNPKCDATHQCVLYVGENQNDFTQPKLFSATFTIASSPANNLPESSRPVLLPIGGVVILAGGAYLLRRRSRHTSASA